MTRPKPFDKNALITPEEILMMQEYLEWCKGRRSAYDMDKMTNVCMNCGYDPGHLMDVMKNAVLELRKLKGKRR